jgi:glycine/D-amino acid oxidase-like deaminating enzyme/nitrite reductase/ring-hydroxylating ferredoxin subunit
MYKTESIWSAYAGTTNFPSLQGDTHVETLIIGGGITGISLAMELSKADRKSIVIEERKVGGGTTSHSTGNLYVSIDKILSVLRKKYSKEIVQKVLASRLTALNRIKEFVSTYQLDCDFQICPWHLYSMDVEDDRIEKELEIANEVGLHMDYADLSEIPYSALKGIKLLDQAQINPMKYVQELAKAIDANYCTIYEKTAATKIEKKGEVYEVTTANGIITTKNVVHATHTPKGVMFLQTLLGPYREYGIAFKAKKRLDLKGIFWGFHEEEKYSTRTYNIGDEQFVLVIGKAHKVGQADNNIQSIRKLESFAHAYFDVDHIAFRWGGQHYRPADLLPYIGHQKDNVFIATGYSTDGLVYGTLAGMIIKDQILGLQNPWTDLFNPSRTDLLKAAENFIKENLNVAKQYIDVLPGTAEDLEFEDIAPGKGKVIERKGHKLAVYRTLDRKIIVKSAVCTHLGCIVAFNDAEQTWDCPCHGSRFEVDGSIIEGPALLPLQEIKNEE